jgi:2-phospho-L-lactate guanylyltransferase
MRRMETLRGPSRSASAGLESLDALVPIRSLAGGKARLGGAIDAEEREELLVGMLRQTVELLVRWPACRTVHVVSADPRALAVASETGAHALPQSGEGLNAGLRLGLEAAADAGATAVMILPADLPLLATSSLDRLLDAADAALAAGSGRPLVVIAPSDARGGTNALLLSPPDVITPSFGAASFEAHARAAAAADATLQLVTDPGLGFDLDTPEDLDILPTDLIEELMALGRDPAVSAAE